MTHLPSLIHDLAIILIVAAITTVIFKMLRQPVVLGYLIAGFFVGPNFIHLPTITEESTIRTLAELGVIFFLFNLGLEFSFKKIQAVGSAAITSAMIEMSLMVGLGYGLGGLLGWNQMDRLFLGGMLAISSTTIILRSFDELNLRSKQFTHLVLGILIIEDIGAILLMVLLSTIAITQQFQGLELLRSTLKLSFFLGLWFIGGLFIVPTAIRLLKRTFTSEILIILSLALCMAMVLLAHAVEFSGALGAFIMGSLLAETDEAKKIEQLLYPMKIFFGAIFFVSVGMLINPTLLLANGKACLLITVALVVGKIVGNTLGCLLARKSLVTSLQTGMSLAQIGEFSFIIATLGLSLKVIGPQLYPIAVGVSVITTFLTPYLIRLSEPLAHKIQEKIPATWRKKLEIYQQKNKHPTLAQSPQMRQQTFFSFSLFKLLLLSFIVMAITLLIRSLTKWPQFQTLPESETLKSALFLVVVILCLPFYWALLNTKTFKNYDFVAHSPSSSTATLFNYFRYGLFLTLLTFQTFSFLPAVYSLFLACLIFILMFYFLSKNIGDLYQGIEQLFEKNISAQGKKQVDTTPLIPWEAHLMTFEIPQDSHFAGQTLEFLKIRESYGPTLVMIERGPLKIKAPSKDVRLFPHDRISAIGTDSQLQQLAHALSVKHPLMAEQIESSGSSLHDTILKSCVMTEQSPFVGKSIRESGLRELTDGLVVGIEREGKRMLNPDSHLILKAHDILWVVGNAEKINKLNKDWGVWL